jgi:hypothetical protein
MKREGLVLEFVVRTALIVAAVAVLWGLRIAPLAQLP